MWQAEEWRGPLLLETLLHLGGATLTSLAQALDRYRDLLRVFFAVEGGQQVCAVSLGRQAHLSFRQ